MGAPAPNVLLVALQGGLIEPVDHLVRVDLVPYPELRTALEPLATPQGAWRHSAREFLAIAALKANLFEDAGRWFDAIVTDPQSPAVLRQRTELYLALVRGGPVETKN